MAGMIIVGKVHVGPRLTSGLPGPLRHIGDASLADVGLEEQVSERQSHTTVSPGVLRRRVRSLGGSLQLKFDEFTPENLAFALQAKVEAAAAGAAVAGHSLGGTVGAPLKVGDVILLPGKNVSAVVVKDSTGVPKVLVKDVNYRIDEFAGSIEIINLTVGGAYVMPLVADYTPGAVQIVGAFTTSSPEMYVRLDGYNADDGSRVIVDIYRCRFSATKKLPLIAEDFTDFELDGSLLADTTKAIDAIGGQYFSVTRPA